MAAASKMNTVATVGSILAQVFAGPLGGAAAGYGMQNAGDHLDANLQRHIEAQADEEGARIIAATNTFNPYGMIWFFQTMTQTYGAGQAAWSRSHPLDQARIDDLRNLMAADPQTFGKFKDTQSREVAYW
jgi:predicted Zn-dependent protease